MRNNKPATESPGDLDVMRFADLLNRLPAHLPISDAMEQADSQKTGRWWTSQREHMVGWFRAQTTTGAGAFTRAEPNRSAKITYNRLQCPEGLVWIAEALGANPDMVSEVAQAALQVPRRSRSGFVRKNLPWELIAELATSRLGSHRR